MYRNGVIWCRYDIAHICCLLLFDRKTIGGEMKAGVLTASEAKAKYKLSDVTFRKWKRTGKLEVSGYRGRETLYKVAEGGKNAR